MFRPRREPDPALAVVVTVEGRMVRVPAGASAAAAVLAAGWRSIRETPVGGPSTSSGERGPYCMIGACFDCLAEIDGVANRQSCMVTVRPGMTIRRQRRARAVG
ncbi:MAG TPA: 2Fe-2S iron-sulfur cluster-binding protein [Stellaceae bacterium]|nr:2Fe-2S iron-sulfur cluster-binding protein [Stellaceae bacterium]